MSENLNRSNPDFSKYDSMSIEELEEILRADAQGPERADSDVDEILYVMEVLAKKRRQNGIAGKTALEAYQEFQQHYLPKAEEKSKSRHKSIIIPFRRIAAVAASLVLVFSLTTTANAFSIKDVWNAVVTWAQETFSFSMGVEVSEPVSHDEIEYTSILDVITQYKIDPSLVPTWVPEGFYIDDVIIDESPIQEKFIFVLSNKTERIKIVMQSYLATHPEQIEVSDELIEVYNVSDTSYYITHNNDLLQAAWLNGTYECYISGELTIDEIKLMIDSIGKG